MILLTKLAQQRQNLVLTLRRKFYVFTLPCDESDLFV